MIQEAVISLSFPISTSFSSLFFWFYTIFCFFFPSFSILADRYDKEGRTLEYTW
jgi:hypothetical protein